MSATNIEKHEFQAEIKQLLDIVIHSLYTEKEIFVRELISNSSDALEKIRHVKLTEKDIFDKDLDLEIKISTDDTAPGYMAYVPAGGLFHSAVADLLGSALNVNEVPEAQVPARCGHIGAAAARDVLPRVVGELVGRRPAEVKY